VQAAQGTPFRTGKTGRATAIPAIVLLLSVQVLTGCVSSSSHGGDALSYQPAIEVAAVETSGASDLLPPGKNDAAAQDPALQLLASVVPLRAPREGNGNPLLAQGSTMEIVYTPPVLAQKYAYAATDPATGENSAARSKFEQLMQNYERAHARGDRRIAALPGVKLRDELFALDGDEHEEGGEIRVASVSGFGRLSPSGLRLQRESVQVDCFGPELMSILTTVEKRYGKKPIVTSGYRSAGKNRQAGGARRSLHIACKAADIQVEGVSKWQLAKFLREVPGRGGVGTYCRTESVHVDIGEVRDWHYPCRNKKKRRISA